VSRLSREQMCVFWGGNLGESSHHANRRTGFVGNTLNLVNGNPLPMLGEIA